MPFDRHRMKQAAAALAAKGVFIGTSSWKYEGWLGQLYTPARYEYRGKVAVTRFERDCLSEYAEVFKTVCVDAAYYTFPRPDYLQKLADQVPDDFRFGLKVTDAITIKKFPTWLKQILFMVSFEPTGHTDAAGFAFSHSSHL